MFSGINFWAVLVGGVIYFILGGIWYAAVFSKQYQAGLDFNPEQRAAAEKEFPRALAGHFFSGLLTSLVVAVVVRHTGSHSFLAGMGIGLLLWAGFAFTINLNYLLFEKRPLALFWLNNGFFLIALPVIAGMLSVWRN